MEKRTMRRRTVTGSLLAMLLFSGNALADPLDRGEAYTSRPGPPEWMDNVDLGLLLVDYGIFALTLIGLGWLLFKKPEYLARLESVVRAPFASVFATAKRIGGVGEFVLQMFGGLAAFIALAAWVFFCQWLKHMGLGALAMIGLAFAALLLVRMIKGSESALPVP